MPIAQRLCFEGPERSEKMSQTGDTALSERMDGDLDLARSVQIDIWWMGNPGYGKPGELM
jgi:hypothetical protein